MAQKAIVREIKQNYLKPHGLSLSIDEKSPNRHEGSKEERIASILDARYDNMMIWHYRGGNCQLLEEELMLDNPAHDDIKDALSSAVDVSVAPSPHYHRALETDNVLQFHSRFGGVSN